ncbi:MAG: hypothetical protein J6X76_02985 [Bacteroidaceae bacterium]|nr:hypothetical protein [Bacteroidaceae bacterium]
MKKHLFLFLCTLLSMLAGVQKVQAYTVENLVEDGWTLVNTESVTGVADNFYVLVDAYSSAYVMSAQADHFRPCYKTINSPLENPSFVWSLEGSDNSFKLKSAATGAYIKQASGWNTSVGYPRDGRGVATCTFTLNGGKYDLKCIESNAMVGHWNDGTSGVAQDGEDIAANKSTAAADGFFLYAKPKADYIAALAAARQTAVAEASQTNPVEVTSWIQNPDFSNDWGGWECTLSSSGNMQWGQKTLESWNAGNVVVKQVLSGVPDGLYRLSADLISGNNDNKTAYVFAVGAGEVKSDPVSAVASAGNYNTMSAEVAGNTLAANNIVVTNGVLTVGFNQPSGWIVADNFKLYYMGEDMSIYVEAYHNALTTAQGVDQTAPMNAAVLATLQQALTDYAAVDETSKAALQEATGALGTAASNAINSIAAYAKATSAIATAEALQVNNNFVTAAAATTFAEAIAAIKTPYTNGTLTNEEASNAETTLGVINVGWHAEATNTPAANYMRSTWPASLTVNDWSVEGVTDGSDYLVPFFQDWIGDGESLATKTWTGTLTGLENGVYQVSAWVRVRAKDGTAAGDATGITMKVNDGEAVDVTEGEVVGTTQFQLATYNATGSVIDGTLNLNFDIANTNISWLSFKDVKYVRTGDLDPTEYRAAVADRLETAQGLVNEVMNADVAANLNDKIAATAGYEESTDTDALEQMAADLDVANAAAEASIANYKEAAAIINAASVLDETGQAVYNANNKVLELKALYDNKTLVAVTDEQKTDCKAALKTAVKAQTTDGADWTLLIDNPGFEGTFKSIDNPQANRDIYQPEGWTAVWANGNENDLTSLNSSCTQWNNFADMPQPADGGNNVYWARYRWGSQSSITLKQTVNLPAGLYELGAEGYLSNATNGKATLSVKFGDEVALVDFTAAAWTKKAVSFSISEAQDVEILYNFTENAAVEIKAGVDNFTLTSRAAADADDYAALNAAIKNAESMKVGFKAGEYAPYTNIAVLAPLAVAKAIDQTAVNAKSAVVIATSLLNGAQSTWVENEGDMPIVFNSTFGASENDGAPAGWETDNAAGLGGAYHARAFVLNPGDGNYDRLASFDQGDATRSAFYVRFDGTNSTRTTDYTYGETVGYTMPLEAGVYRVKLMAGGWGQTQPLNVKFEDAESTIKGEQTVEMTNIADGSGVAASFNFLSEVAAGDYKLVVSNGNIDANNAAAFSNVEITLEMTAAELAALREEIILLRTQVEGYTELPEPLATEAAAAVGEAYAYINEHECDPAKLNASKDRLQAVVDAAAEAEAKAAWQAQIAAAQALAADDDAVAVGKLRDAIEVATIIIIPTDEEKAALQAAVDQFNLDNADQESDQTAKVATNGWKKFDGSAAGVCATQFAPAIDTYDGRKNVNLAESYEEGTAEGTAVTRLGTIIYQDITGLKNGSYKVGFYGNAFFTEGRAGMTSPMADGATDVAYVFANDQQAFITAHIATSTTVNNFKEFNVEVTDGTIRLGMGKEKAGTNWHTMQIYQLTWFTTAKALYALDKADMEAAILLAGTLYEDPYKTNGKEALQQAIAEANAARISNHLNIAEFEAEIAKLNDAIKAYKEANYVALSGTYYVKNAAGKFMAAGHNWGTRGIVNETGLDLTLTPNNENKVAIDSRVYNGNNHFLGSNLYMDSGSFAWVIEQVGAEEYSIGNGAQYIGVDAEDNLALVNEPFAWQFLDAATLDATRLADGLAAMAAATADNGVDATFLLKDANFNRNDHRWEAWTVEFVSGDNKNLGGGCDGGNGNGNAESFHSAFNIYQTIANAPAGVYKMTAQGFYRQDDAVEEAAPVFYIGDVTAEVPVKTGSEGSMTDASYSFTDGLYTIDPIEFTLDEEGDLTVGIKNGENVHQWVIFDNFRLTYFGAAPAPKTDYTDYIINADLSDSESTAWNLAGTKGYHNSGNAVTCGNNAVFDFCQVVQNLPAGQYKLTAKSAYRYSGSEADEYAAIESGTETKFASLYAKVGTKTFSSLVQNRWDGASDVDYAAGSGSVVVNEKFVPNSTAAVKAWFNADKYVNEVVFNLTADGDVTIGIAKDAQPAAGDFTVIGGWTLTRLGDAQPEYAITVAPAENGNVVADKATAAAGETVKVTATPDEGYMVDYGYYVYNETQYDFESIDMDHNIATFTMPAGPVSVVLAFKQAKVAYQFVPSEWGAGDPGRISPENVVANDVAGTITVDKTGANNVNLNFHTTKRYVLSASQRYFVIKATGLATGDTDSYLWWLNHNNNGSQIVPTAIFVENGETVFAWDAITSGIGGTIGLEETELNGTAEWTTTFGMTLADANVPAVISYIGFQETIPEPVEEEAYEFVPSEWGAGDPGRISPENVVADDDMGTITVTQTGDNNVALLFKTNKLYYVENVDYFVIKAKGVSTETGASYLWWLNGKNDNGAQFAPTSTATEADGTIILEWKISECGNIGENINPAGKSYLVGGDGWNTTFGLTQADALTPVVISYIGYGTKSATDISALKSQDAEGALKDGKYLIKGEIIVVKNGRMFKANGQLK